MRNLFLFLFIFLFTCSFILSLVSAVPPVQTTISDAGLQIAYPQYQYFPSDTNFTLYIHVYNTTQYITGATASCYLDLYDPSGIEIMKSIMTEDTSDYYIFVNANNFTSYGTHAFVIQCNTTGQAGFANGVFEISPTGKEQTSILNNNVIIIFILLAIFMLVLGIYTSIPWLGFISSLMFLLGGIYTMIYGFNNVTDLYTRGVAVTLIGIGLIFMISSAYEWIASIEES